MSENKYIQAMEALEQASRDLSQERKRRRIAEQHVRALCEAAGYPNNHPLTVASMLKDE